tara:strand:- start:500 stop:739 length:240 start_codon:yes stop_codon:yes gene_type:complete
MVSCGWWFVRLWLAAIQSAKKSDKLVGLSLENVAAIYQSVELELGTAKKSKVIILCLEYSQVAFGFLKVKLSLVVSLSY